MKSDDTHLFIAYIEGELPATELESFENRLNEDSEFADSFEEFKDIYRVLENQFSPDRAAVLENIQKADSQFKLTNSSEDKSKKVIPFRPWQMGVAASILLVIGFFIFNDSGKPSYSDYANVDEVVLTVRSETDSISKKAEITFNSRDYEEAISYFDSLLEESPDNTEIQFYKAIALIEINSFSKADQILISLSEGNSVYVYKAVYWQALSRIKQKKYEEAKAILHIIPTEAPEYVKAHELLSKL